jgi:protein gp37
MNKIYNTGAKESCRPSKTNIAWTNATFNPVWGCEKVSEACKNCYAETISRSWGFGTKRPDLWKDGGGEDASGKGWEVKNGRRVFGNQRWEQLLRWNKNAKLTGEKVLVFAGSMCDVFEDHSTTAEELEKLWGYIKKTPNLTYQLLTKRPENILRKLPSDWANYKNGYSNVWLGTTVENQNRAWRFNEFLADIPASVRFVSYEPALGPIDLRWGELDWLIAGGESGVKRRPFDYGWARDVHEKCKSNKVAFFYKQDTAFRSSTNPYLDGKKYYEWPDPRVLH